MTGLKRILGTLGEHAERQFESRRLRNPFAAGETIVVQTYRSFGTSHRLQVRGRVLVDRGIAAADDQATVWQNLLGAYKRLHSREVAGAELRLRYGSVEQSVRTDDEGYFTAELELRNPILSDDSWSVVDLDMVEPRSLQGVARAEVLIPPENAEYGVVSDLDDTVIKTGATALTTMVRTVLLQNSRTREPFEGVSDFYRALQAGSSGKASNPIFYVSSGPWNLYDLYADFMDFRGVPRGPILLSDYGVDEKKLIHSSHSDHKLAAIREIFTTYPGLSFILIGDSGQEDPEIYREVVREYPGRVKAIYIRDVTLPERDRVVLETGSALQQQGVEMVLIENTQLAANHALGRGFIVKAAAEHV